MSSTSPLDQLPTFEIKASEKERKQSQLIADAITKQLEHQKRRDALYTNDNIEIDTSSDNWTKIELKSGEKLVPAVKRKLKEKNIKYEEEEVEIETDPPQFYNQVYLSWLWF